MLPNGGLPMTAAQRVQPTTVAAAVERATSAPDADDADEAAKAVTAKKAKDPYLEAIRRVRDIYAGLPVKVRNRVHSIVGQLYVDDQEDLTTEAQGVEEDHN